MSRLPSPAPRPRRALVIVNPSSGRRGRLRKALRRLEREARKRRVCLEVRQTGGAGDARSWARQAAAYDLIIVVGGDGTVTEAIGGLVAAGLSVPLAQLPMGSANVLAMTLGVPRLPRRAAAVALSGTPVPFDVGHLPELDRHFALAVSVGWHARVIRDASRPLKRVLGAWAYVLSGLRNALAMRPRRLTIEVDGRQQELAAHTLMIVNVGGPAGAAARVRGAISPHDGLMEVAVLRPRSVGGMIMLLVRWLTRGLSARDDVRARAAASLRVHSEPPLGVQVDGEVVGTTPVEVRVLPSAVRLVVPQRYARDRDLLEVPSQVVVR